MKKTTTIKKQPKRRSVFVHQNVNIEIKAEKDASTLPLTGLLTTENGGEFEFDELNVRIHSNGPRRWFPKKVYANTGMRVTTNIETGEWKVQVRLSPEKARNLSARQLYDLAGQFEEALDLITVNAN